MQPSTSYSALFAPDYEKKEVRYVFGFSEAQIKYVAVFFFGNKFVGLEILNKEKTFLLYFNDSVNVQEVEHFCDYFNVMYELTNYSTVIKLRKFQRYSIDIASKKGLTISNLNKVAPYYFGAKFLYSRKDFLTRNYILTLDSTVEDYKIKAFADYFDVIINVEVSKYPIIK